MKPRILLTIGDINGIGPEIIIKSLRKLSGTSKRKLAVVSSPGALEHYSKLLRIKLPSYELIPIGSVRPPGGHPRPGKVTKESGRISGLAIKKAIELCLQKKFDAIVTAPISKEALNLGGFKYDGHTEMLADLSGARHTAMIMVHKDNPLNPPFLRGNLIIGFASTHPPLRKVADLITGRLLKEKITVCCDSLVNDFGVKNPRIGVLSLNPHAGDGGLIGGEEIKIIKPALTELRKKLRSAVIEGPFPSDSYFGNQTYKKFDMTFALYHDQGFIPFKMIAGNYGVNFTAGLPFIRSSPDHGTAFDIAGKNIADPVSMLEAIKTAANIFSRRCHSEQSEESHQSLPTRNSLLRSE
jgi:4-hydroxythreonine-4-phosphate dehydrogenase